MSDVSQSTKDLHAARAAASFSSDKLGALLEPQRAAKREVRDIIAHDPAFEKGKKAYMSRAQRLETGFKMANRLHELTEKHKWDPTQYKVALEALDEALSLQLHESAFQPVINNQGSDEQKKVWMPLCINKAILGCYLQTELSHGSNVQRLETTATYLPETEEFEIHSPTIGSTKWWIGALGLSATHGAVQARLIIKGQDYGPHLFLCQLRSLEDHSLMPGIEAGEIGPKAFAGYSAVDNGWARFNHVKVPRNQMLNRFANVSKDGTYTKPPHAKLAYGGMLYIRAQMIEGLGWSLAKASTISTRYLHARRQFGTDGKQLERQVFTYPSVYMRIIPQIAKSIVFIIAGKDMTRLYTTLAGQLASGDTTLLAEAHAVSSGLKVLVSTQSVEGMEINRRACGGHGYMDAAGIGRIYASLVPSTTYEGDNFILNLQVARSALKAFSTLQADPKSKLTPSSMYLSSLSNPAPPRLPSSGAGWRSRQLQVQLASRRAASHVQRLAELLKAGRDFDDLSWECVNVSKAVVEAHLVRVLSEALEKGGVLSGAGPSEKAVLERLLHFYALYTLEQASSDLLEFGILPPGKAMDSPLEVLRMEVDSLAKSLLPEAVSLVDSFGFTDYDLDTVLGRYEGRPYESLLEKAQNDLDFNAGDAAARKRFYEQSVQPILQRGAAMASRSKL